jgi:hypothetical protein
VSGRGRSELSSPACAAAALSASGEPDPRPPCSSAVARIRRLQGWLWRRIAVRKLGPVAPLRTRRVEQCTDSCEIAAGHLEPFGYLGHRLGPHQPIEVVPRNHSRPSSPPVSDSGSRAMNTQPLDGSRRSKPGRQRSSFRAITAATESLMRLRNPGEAAGWR